MENPSLVIINLQTAFRVYHRLWRTPHYGKDLRSQVRPPLWKNLWPWKSLGFTMWKNTRERRKCRFCRGKVQTFLRSLAAAPPALSKKEREKSFEKQVATGASIHISVTQNLVLNERAPLRGARNKARGKSKNRPNSVYFFLFFFPFCLLSTRTKSPGGEVFSRRALCLLIIQLIMQLLLFFVIDIPSWKQTFLKE